MIRRRRHGPRAGFTLVELLVVMVLVGMISVALFGGLRFGIRVWEAGAYRSERLAEIEITQSLLRRLLRQALLLSDEEGEVTFDGDEEYLQFTAPAPAQFGLGGVYLFEIATERVEQGDDLLLRWQLFRSDDRDVPFEDQGESRLLIEGMKEMRIGYFGSSAFEEEPDWQDSWKDNDILPSLVTIDIEFDREDDRVWPTFEVVLRTAADIGIQ